MNRNLFKERAQAGQRPRALWITIPWGPVLEMVGRAGVECALIDLEHTTMSLQQVESLLVSAEAAGVTPIVRPPSTDASLVTRLLDAGALGAVFPRIESAAEAAEAVRTLRYPPAGSRGWGGAHIRAARWTAVSAPRALVTGDDPYTPEYVQRANEMMACLFLIETPAGVAALGDILDAAQPDGVIFGWGDFALETGFDAARCEEAAQAVYEECRARTVGYGLVAADGGRREAYPGCFEMIGVDSVILSSAIRDQAAQA